MLEIWVGGILENKNVMNVMNKKKNINKNKNIKY